MKLFLVITSSGTRKLVDNSFGNRPQESALFNFDNGSVGNYWSDYQGTDLDHDGIGDKPYNIKVYYENALIPYNYVDRYPLITQVNINAQIPQIPSELTSILANNPVSLKNDQTTALLFLQNVLQLDLTKYTTILVSQNIGSPYGGPYPAINSDQIMYNLTSSTSYASATIVIFNNTVTNCNLYALPIYPQSGQFLFTYPFSSDFDSASRIMCNYQAWTNDPEVAQMTNLLISARSNANTTTTSGNVHFEEKNVVYGSFFSWNLTFNGVDYQGVTLSLGPSNQGLKNLSFSDDRGTYKIGSNPISISKEQAISIAEDYVRNYAYPASFANGTTIVNGLEISSSGVSAFLQTSNGVIPTGAYWQVKVPLNKIYSGSVYEVDVQIWADTGTVFEAWRHYAQTNSIGPSTSNQPYPFAPPNNMIILEILLAIIGALIASLIVVLILARRIFRQK